MAYGDNRTSVVNDTFDSSISADYTNPCSGHRTVNWATGGYVEASATGYDTSGMRNDAITLADAQYALIEFNRYEFNQTVVDVGARWGTGSDESRYASSAKDPGSNWFYTKEYNSSGSATVLSSYTFVVPAVNDILTVECEGTTIRTGFLDDSAGTGDLELGSNTDATIEGGQAGLDIYAGKLTGAQTRLTRFEAGDIGAAGGGGPTAGTLSLLGVGT